MMVAIRLFFQIKDLLPGVDLIRSFFAFCTHGNTTSVLTVARILWLISEWKPAQTVCYIASSSLSKINRMDPDDGIKTALKIDICHKNWHHFFCYLYGAF